MDDNTLEILKQISAGMRALLGGRCEAVIHDFTDITKSLVHVEGDVTHRSPGAPITDMAFKLLSEFGDDAPDKLGYKNVTEDGKVLKCSTIFIKDPKGNVVGSFGINYDVTDFVHLSSLFSDYTNFAGSAPAQEVRYAHNIQETMESVMDQAVAEYGKPAAAMTRQDRKNIVDKLEKSGVFMIKGAVQYLSNLLGASRYTIYNYIKECREAA
jgi:predicted transcriptional regulator YheO